MGAVLSLPFVRRRARRPRSRPTAISTPISHPRPLLRRAGAAEELLVSELEVLSSGSIKRPSGVGRSGSGASRNSQQSVSSRSRGTQRVRHREVGEFGLMSEPLAQVAEMTEMEELPSIPSLSSASDSTCSSEVKLATPADPSPFQAVPPTSQPKAQLHPQPMIHTQSVDILSQPPVPLALPQPFDKSFECTSERSQAPSLSGVGSKRRGPSESERRRQRTRSVTDSRRSSLIIGTKTSLMTPAVRRASTIRRHRRRLESGWDLIRHDEADGWAPAAGRASMNLGAGLGLGGSFRSLHRRNDSLRKVQWSRWPQAD